MAPMLMAMMDFFMKISLDVRITAAEGLEGGDLADEAVAVGADLVELRLVPVALGVEQVEVAERAGGVAAAARARARGLSAATRSRSAWNACCVRSSVA